MSETSHHQQPAERAAAQDVEERSAVVATSAAPGARWRERVMLLIIGALLGGGVVAAGSAAMHASASDPPAAPSASAPARERVRLPADLAQRAGIQVEAVAETSISPGIDVVGAIALDPARVSDVGGRVVGRVAQYFVEHGDRVEAGAPLVRIETAELGDAIAEWLAARAELEAASSRAERTRGLSTRQLATAASVEQADADESALTARARGAEHRLLAMGLSRGELERVARGGRLDGITLRAPISGEVIERTAMLGEVVSPTDPILRIAELDSVWVLLDVYERDLAGVRTGDQVDVRTETTQEDAIRGQIEHVDAIVDAETRTGRVRVSIDNQARHLRPGQYVYARLSRGTGARRGILAPRTAVLQLGGEPAAFVAVAEGEYEVRPLRIGATLGELVEVEAGLRVGDRLVVDGAFALKSELQR